MSADKVRNALARIQEDPEDQAAWDDVEEVVTGSNDPAVLRELEIARALNERLRNWSVVAKLLEMEMALDDDDEIVGAKMVELARIYHEELLSDQAALDAYKRAAELRPDDDRIRQAVGEIEFGKANLPSIVEQAHVEALATEDNAVRVPMLLRAAEHLFRYGDRKKKTQNAVKDFLRQALELEPNGARVLALGSVVHVRMQDWEGAAELLTRRATTAPSKDEKIAAAYQLCIVTRRRLGDEKRALDAHQMLVDLDPQSSYALHFLVDYFSKNEEWDHLAALYEDQLHAGGMKPAEELAMWVQLAMLHWKTRHRPDQAERYFEKVRRADPTNAGMLQFYRTRYAEQSDRLVAILTDAQRAMPEGRDKKALAEEIAALAEGMDDSRRAIEQYKTILRADPDNTDARDKLKQLYEDGEMWNALVELHRQDLGRAADTAQRVAILREIAAVYRDKMESDTALLTVLTQILQLEPNDVDAVRGLVKVYESLQRWRDLLSMQQRLAELTTDVEEKTTLLRAVARRWLDQFSNVQNAITAYEALLHASVGDGEAREKLGDLYKKRRAWDKLYELYDGQTESLDGKARTEHLLEMARLAAERLNRGDEAIRLLKEVLVFDPEAEGVLDTLEKQAERSKDWGTVAVVLEKRIEQADHEQAKLALLQKLGVLLSEKLEDHEAASRAWRRVIELSPGHARALRVLRQSYVDRKDWDGLSELYGSQQDWEGLADFLSTSADRATDPATKVDLSFRAARVYEELLSAPERAARSYERILALDDKNVRAATALLPIYEQEEKWSRLPGLYQILLEATADVDEKIGILNKVASITGGPLANKIAALSYARRAYDLRPDDEGLERLRQWSQGAREWSAFVDVVQKRLQAGKAEGSRARELRLMLADTYSNQLARVDDAVGIYKQLLEADASDEGAASRLEELLRAADRRDDLRWLFELKAAQAAGEDRCRILEDWAAAEEEVFGEPGRALDLLRRVVAEDPKRTSALAALTRLLLAAESYREAAAVMAQHRDATEGDERVELETHLARIHLEHLGDPVSAYEACARALQINDRDALAVALLEKLMDVEATRASAAETLERIYAGTRSSEKQAAALRALLESVEDTQRRLELCQRLSDVYERELRDPGSAFEVILAALLEAPNDVALWDRAQELCVAAGRPTDLAQAYRKHLMTEGEPGTARPGQELVLELCERAAVLHEEQLGDAEGAIPYLEKMLAIEPANVRAFDRLKTILNTTERWSDLETLYQTTIDVADDRQKADLLHQAALVAEDMVGDDGKAIGYYERILAIDALHPQASDALERLYGREERWKELAALLERKLQTATEAESAAIHQQLVDLYLHRLHENDEVTPHLEELLRLRGDDLDARQLAEECLGVADLRQQAAQLLDRVYEAVDDPRNLVRVLDVRLEGAKADEDRRELYGRIAHLRDDRLKDDKGAFEALCALMPLEPDDTQIRQRLLAVGKRLGEHRRMAESLVATAARSSSPPARGEILMHAAALFRDRLEEPARAEEVYRQILAIDPDDAELVVPAAKALAEIYQEETAYQKLAEVLSIQVKLVDDAGERADLYARIANIREELLEDEAKAIEAWRCRLGDDANDPTALKALERLYERTDQWRDLVEVLRQMERGATDGDERKRCMVKAAQVLADDIGETAEAISAWRAVLDDFGPEPETLSALAKLYKKAERWQDLAEIYDTWLTLAEDNAQRVELFAGLGDVQRKYLDDPKGALGAYREVLTIDPAHQGARDALEQMLSHDDPEIKREAAEIIGPLYDADGDATRLLKVLDIEIEATFDPSARLETLERALRTAEDTVQSSTQAFDYAARGVREAIGDPSIKKWLDTVERLAEETSRFPDLLDLYERVIGDMLDAEVQQQTRLRAGEIARRRLQDRDRAVKHYRGALEAQADDRRAMIALEELYQETSDSSALLEILKLRAESAENDDERVKHLFRIAEIHSSGAHGGAAGGGYRDATEGATPDHDQAIRTYEELLDIKLDPKAVGALEELYSKADRWDDLVRLYERELDKSTGDRAAEVRVHIARVAHDKLGDTPRALDELGEALRADDDHHEAIVTLEKLLATLQDPDQRAQVAEMLEPVYMRRHSWDKLQSVLEARLEVTQDPGDRRELMHRLATLYEEQLENYGAALETVAKQLREDPGSEEIWEEVQRLGRVLGDGSERRVAEIFAAALSTVDTDDPKTARLSARTGELFAQVNEHESALLWYRRAHAFDPDDAELFEAIDKLLVKLGRPEDRIAHYRAALEHTLEQKPRVHYLHVIARLEQQLGRNEDAVRSLTELLEIEERDEEALDALTQLYQKNEQKHDLAEHYERRAELADDPEKAAPFRLSLAKLLAQDEDGRDRALDQIEIVVTDIPWHEGAIAMLEDMIDDQGRKQRVLEMLRPLYERADHWRGLVKLNEERLKLADIPDEKVEVLMDTARLWEDRGDEPGKAFDVVRQAFELVPENQDTRAVLERLCEALDAWEELVDSYAQAADELDDELTKRQLFDALATICDERLDDPRRALGAVAKLSALDTTDPEPLDRMDRLCMLLSDWPMLVKVIEQKIENASADQDRAELLSRLGGVKRDMLGDDEGAIKIYEEALEVAPESVGSIDRLIELYESRDPARLTALYEQRIRYADPSEADLRHQLTVKAAEVFETRLEKPEEAIRMLQMALDERPTDRPVLKALERLYRAEELNEQLLDNLKTQASVTEDKAERIDLRSKIGDLYLAQFDNAIDALEQYRLVLEEDEQNEHAVAQVRIIGEKYEERRLEVAALLEPVLSAGGHHQDLVNVMELRYAAETDPADRARTLRAIALIQEEQLEQDQKARDTLLRALAETPEDATLHDDVQRLCELTGQWQGYADALRERAEAIFDAVVQTDLYTRLGRVADERLGDKPRAIEAYKKAADQAEDPKPLFEALDRLYGATENWTELGRVIERRIELELGGPEQAELQYRLGKLQIERFDDKSAGLAALRLAADLHAEHKGVREELEKLTDEQDLFEEVAEALDAMYRVAGDGPARARLRNKRISYAPTAADRVRLRLELAQMLEEESFDQKSAQDVVQEAFADDPTDPELLAQLERLASANGGGDAWRRAADAVGEAVAAALAKGDAEAPVTPELARDLYLRSAGWYKDKVGDAAAAEKRLRAALEQDPKSSAVLLALEEIQRSPGREKDLVDTLRKLAELGAGAEGVDREPAALRREAKVLAESPIGDLDLAEKILREMLAADDADVWALTELCAVAERHEDWKELYTLLNRRIELLPTPEELRELRHRAASIAAERLADEEAAINLHEQAFEEDPRDEVSATALRALYQKLGRHEPLLRFLERLLELQDDKPERAKLRLEMARICIDVLSAPTEGIEHLNAVLDEVPGHEGAVGLLAKMLEKEGRDDELAELLNKQIELARTEGDQQKELAFRVKLAELYESRLNDPDKAIAGYLAVLERDGSFRPALEALARLYEQQDKPDKAADTYEKLLTGAAVADLPRLAEKARDLFVSAGDKGAGSRVLEAALERKSELGKDEIGRLRDGLRSLYREREAWDRLADLTRTEADEAESPEDKRMLLRKAAEIHAQQRNDHAAAAELLEKALELKSDDRDLMLQLCDEYTASGRGKDAIAVLNRVVESYGGRRSKELADIHHRIASAHLADGDKDAALAELEAARKMDPGSVQILYELGTLSIKLVEAGAENAAKDEHLKRAGNAFRSLLLQRLEGELITKAEVFYQLARVHQQEGDKKKALQMAERALASDRAHQKAQSLAAELKG
jgi:tetratricopeptide (TPR) repeat protein